MAVEDEKIEDILKPEESEKVCILQSEYDNLLSLEQKFLEKEEENIALKQKINKLEIDLKHRGSMAEAGRLAVLVQELQDLYEIAGKEAIVFSESEKENLKAVILAKIKELIKEEEISYSFTDKEDLSVIMQNLKLFVQSKRAEKITAEEIAIASQIAKS